LFGGDTLVIGPGSYRLGFGAPGADSCESDYPWDCHMPPIPSGPSADDPTRILGAGWNENCADPPELWGAERAMMLLNLDGSSNVEIACLELTDHESCVAFHADPALACPRDDYPYSDWASLGLYAADSANVRLTHLNIHGLAELGVLAGRLTDWTVEDVRLAGNGLAGWDGDIEDKDANAGRLIFRRFTVEWNGCGETYPGKEPTGCWGQTAGGYGDGLGTGETQGHWIFEDSAFLYNTSDGLDLLYARPGSTIEVRRTISRGNAGNQIKTSGPALIENVIAVSNCSYFEGQAFTHHVDPCRAGGGALALMLWQEDEVTVVNSTITGEGDCLVTVECAEGAACNGGETGLFRNNIFLGQTDFAQPFENSCLIWVGESGFPHDPLDVDYSLVERVKAETCRLGRNDLCQLPGVMNLDVDAFDARLNSDSPAVNAGSAASAPDHDFVGNPRDDLPDIGAYEWHQR
jgi:hypothetical protein